MKRDTILEVEPRCRVPLITSLKVHTSIYRDLHLDHNRHISFLSRRNKRWSRLMLQSLSSSSWLIDTIISILTQEHQTKISWRTSNCLTSSLWGLVIEFFSSKTSLAQTRSAAGASTAMEKELQKCAVQPLFMLLIEKTQKYIDRFLFQWVQVDVSTFFRLSFRKLGFTKKLSTASCTRIAMGLIKI